MRKRILYILGVFTVLLATAAFTSPDDERRHGIFLLSGIYNECRDPGPGGWCCKNCKWLPVDECDTDADCQEN